MRKPSCLISEKIYTRNIQVYSLLLFLSKNRVFNFKESLLLTTTVHSMLFIARFVFPSFKNNFEMIYYENLFIQLYYHI